MDKDIHSTAPAGDHGNRLTARAEVGPLRPVTTPQCTRATHQLGPLQGVLAGPLNNVTANFGLDVGTGKAVLGCPADCGNPQSNRYLIHIARSHGVPVRDTLADTVTATLRIVAAAASPASRSIT
ncbi:hypothetical protein [Streptomyces sp. RG80]|uniref:hypothetical protein n=1 Tax=Streptomyces sp. RG80 TaxID=3157340 RepID=UPI00338E7982